MKTSFKIAALAIILGVFAHQMQAQEILTGFQSGIKPAPTAKATKSPVVTLPFFDDFSKSRVYPDATKWTDRNVLVNDGFPLNPPTRNAVTLDVLDENGKVYDYAISNPFVAEYLTSARIRLDSIFEPTIKSLSPADSVYFSFYYQPQGNGNPPEDQDSLVLQFGTTVERQEFLYIDYQQVNIQDIFSEMQVDTLFPGDTIWNFGEGCNPNLFAIITDTLTHLTQGSIAIPCDSVFETVADTTWYHIWSIPGQTLEQFMIDNDGQYFKQVMIPITDPRFFRPDFYFRFYNYASIVSSLQPSGRGNEDNWNIDLVYLNINRRKGDGSIPMLAFSGKAPSFLKRYQAMPYSQYKVINTAAISESFNLDIANLDSQEHQFHYYYTVDQVDGNQHYKRELEAKTIAPYQQIGFFPCNPEAESPACPYVGQAFSIDPLRDTTSYLICHYIYDSTSMPPMVDSLVYRQGFYNYFAYDDGTPELGYGIEPANGSFAVKFELTNPDKICGVQMLFNHTLNDANDKYFDIVIWKEQNGHPGEEVYRMKNQRPRWEEQPYKFSYYEFDKKTDMAGIFYMGLVQQSSGVINIGFDSSNDNSQYTFYNVTGSWMESQYPGSIMLRPVVGDSYYIGVEENTNNTVSLYPNPASSILNIKGIEASEISNISLYDIMGRKLFQDAITNQIAIDDFNDGLYFIQITTHEGQNFTQKFIIRK